MTTSPTLTEPKPASSRLHEPSGSISTELLTEFRKDFDSRPTCRLAQNAVTQSPTLNVALNRSIVADTDHTFSHLIDDWEVTNQKKSGRCWMFAALNLFRAGAMKKMNLKSFEFSQNYTLFWDKFERANYFLEAIIETANRPIDDRTVCWLLDRPLDDGGQWNMFVNVVHKHGLAAKSAMPESESSSDTNIMNGVLLAKLREGAKTLRELRSNGAPMEAARAAKKEILGAVHRILSVHLGTPPARFDWQWNDKDRNFHRDGTMTPQQFAEKYVELPLDEYVCLVNDPRAEHPYGKTYTVEYLGNVVGGAIVKYLNIEIDLMKDIAARILMDGEPVWFGCDVGKMMHRDLGLWDAKLFDFGSMYGTTFDFDKEGRLDYHHTLMTHAMLFTGVDMVNEKPRRWRVENSWGDEIGRKGFFVMNDSWFDEHMFEIAAHQRYLPEELRNALDAEPIVLPPWDPMGALAR